MDRHLISTSLIKNEISSAQPPVLMCSVTPIETVLDCPGVSWPDSVCPSEKQSDGTADQGARPVVRKLVFRLLQFTQRKWGRLLAAEGLDVRSYLTREELDPQSVLVATVIRTHVLSDFLIETFPKDGKYGSCRGPRPLGKRVGLMRTDITTVGARIARFEEPWFCKSCLFHFIIIII